MLNLSVVLPQNQSRSCPQARLEPVWIWDTPGTGRPGIMQRTGFFAWICLILSIVAGASASTYYVSPGGSDLNTGTTSQPWRSINYAGSAVAAGDTVLVQPGIYDERIILSVSRSE